MRKEEAAIRKEEEKIKEKEERMLSSFAHSFSLFWASKRLRWLSVVFVFGLIWTTFIYSYGPHVIPSGILLTLTILTGGLWPFFFMLAAALALLHLERLIASQTSYRKSFSILLPWLALSGYLVLVVWTRFLAAFLLLIFGVAFFGWVSFQAFFATRTSLHYADDVYMKSHNLLIKGLAVLSNFFCYAAIIGSFYFTVYVLNPSEILNQPREIPLIVGTVFALGFNFANFLYMVRHRHTTILDNLALFGLFISLYSAYFIYEAGRPITVGINWVSVSISVFFVIYTMGSVGETLREKSHIRAHWTLTAESSAALTFFLASGYYFADAFLSVLFAEPALATAIGVTFKLLIFPFVAVLTEAHHMITRVGAPPERTLVPDQIESGPGSTEGGTSSLQ
ncbi:MAG: hypothetical protein C4K47_01760 [Candidatus Thorarchaeota archaeon]|nr:MAG: hypothetical protein C4K47_01760 [Candidatus Thorarchaeota archaeon]